MITLIATARLSDEAWEQLRAPMQAMITAAREEKGCLYYSYGRDIIQPEILYAIEKYTDRAALDYHFTTPHMAAFKAALAAAGPLDLKLEIIEGDFEPVSL